MLFCAATSFVGMTDAADLLEQSFQQARQNEYVPNLGNTKNAVGNEIFRGGTDVTVDFSEGIDVSSREPLLVRWTKYLLRLTIVISVTMIIYNGIQFIVAAGDEGKISDGRDKLIDVAIGIVLALSSVGLIYLVQSLTKSTISLQSIMPLVML